MLQLQRDNIDQLAQWIHSNQVASVAEAVDYFLRPGSESHPPAAIDTCNNVESISDLIGEHSAGSRTEAPDPTSESTTSALAESTDHGTSTGN
jgi:hypothetical protein